MSAPFRIAHRISDTGPEAMNREPRGDADTTSNGLAEPNFRPAYKGRQWIPKVGTEENLLISETGSGDTVSAKFRKMSRPARHEREGSQRGNSNGQPSQCSGSPDAAR